MEPLLTRLDELGSLRDGWLDAQGQAPDVWVIDTLRSMASDLTAQGMPTLRVYPTPEGGVQLEWRSGTVERSAEVRADLSVYAVEVDTDGGEANEWKGKLDPKALLGLIRSRVSR